VCVGRTALEAKAPLRVNTGDEIRVGSTVFDVQIEFKSDGMMEVEGEDAGTGQAGVESEQ
jgi:hypothetical protein